MKSRGYVFWLILFTSGSVLWLWSTPWSDLIGRMIVWSAAFIGVGAPLWRTEAQFRKPWLVIGVQLANMLPLFVVGSYPSLSSRPVAITAAYVIVAIGVLAANSYVGLSRRGGSAA
jgi:hypothetical protein